MSNGSRILLVSGIRCSSSHQFHQVFNAFDPRNRHSDDGRLVQPALTLVPDPDLQVGQCNTPQLRPRSALRSLIGEHARYMTHTSNLHLVSRHVGGSQRPLQDIAVLKSMILPSFHLKSSVFSGMV